MPKLSSLMKKIQFLERQQLGTEFHTLHRLQYYNTYNTAAVLLSCTLAFRQPIRWLSALRGCATKHRSPRSNWDKLIIFSREFHESTVVANRLGSGLCVSSRFRDRWLVLVCSG